MPSEVAAASAARSVVMTTDDNANGGNQGDGYLKDEYDHVCSAYERIDDFRAKLLGFLPVVSGGGLFFLLKQADEAVGQPPSTTGDVSLLVISGGIIGAIFTLGLLVYEERGIHYCVRLIALGGMLEDRLKIYPGRFRHWPEGGVSRLVNEPVASGIVYSAILAAWSFVAMSSMPKLAVAIALLIGLTSLVLTNWFFRHVRKKELKKAGSWPPEGEHEGIYSRRPQAGEHSILLIWKALRR
jgi:hypothetical protein